jgi:hypothetical protein
MPAQAAVGINKTVNFQGKVTNADGTNVTDGTYSFDFKIYAVASGGTAVWSELAKSVPVASGIFQTALGSATPFASLVDFNSDSLYLGVKFNNDAAGEMSPRVQFTASPYAMNSDALDGLNATAFGQLTSVSNLFKPSSNSLTAFQIQPAASITPVLDIDTTNSRVGINTAAPGYALDIQGGDANVSGVFRQGGTNVGQSLSCASNNIIQNQVTSGGITTGGTCASVNLQSAYDNSTSPATMSLGTSGKNLVVNATDQTVDPSILFNLQCATCSAGAGLFAVQDNGANILTANPTGQLLLSPTAGQNVTTNLAAGSAVTYTATAAPTVDIVTISNSGQPAATVGVNALNIIYVGGAIPAAAETSAENMNVTPGSTSTSVWDGLHISAAAGAASGVLFNGIKLDGPASPGAGTETGLNIVTGWDVGVNIQSGGIQMLAMSNPTAPAASNLRVYAQNVAGRTMLKTTDSTGANYALQPSLFQSNAFLVTPGNDAAAGSYSSIGGPITKAGTMSPTGGSPSITQGYMGNIATAATANSGAGVGAASAQFFRGSSANDAAGYFFFTRVSLSDALAKYANTTTGSRLFFGLSDQVVATGSSMIITDTPTGNYSGFSFSGVRDTASGFFQFSTRNGTTQTNASTGVTLAVGKTYDFYINCSLQCATVNWRIDNQTDGIAPVEGSTATTLPTATTGMYCEDMIAPLESVAHNLRFQKLYCETER